jgi:hypothetical protein
MPAPRNAHVGSNSAMRLLIAEPDRSVVLSIEVMSTELNCESNPVSMIAR